MAKLFALGSLVVVGIIVADVLSKPAGTKAAGNAVAGILTPSEAALLGKQP